jgi:hypothetical protein
MDWRTFFNRQESTIYSQTLPWIISRALIDFELFFIIIYLFVRVKRLHLVMLLLRRHVPFIEPIRSEGKLQRNHSRQTQTTSIIIFPLRNEMIKCLRGAHLIFIRFTFCGSILFDCLRIFLIDLKRIKMYDFIKRVIQSCCMA